MRHAERTGALVVVCIAVWLVAGAGYFWPIWVILFFGLRLGLLARRAYGSRYDDE